MLGVTGYLAWGLSSVTDLHLSEGFRSFRRWCIWLVVVNYVVALAYWTAFDDNLNLGMLILWGIQIHALFMVMYRWLVNRRYLIGSWIFLALVLAGVFYAVLHGIVQWSPKLVLTTPLLLSFLFIHAVIKSDDSEVNYQTANDFHKEVADALEDERRIVEKEERQTALNAKKRKEKKERELKERLAREKEAKRLRDLEKRSKASYERERAELHTQKQGLINTVTEQIASVTDHMLHLERECWAVQQDIIAANSLNQPERDIILSELNPKSESLNKDLVTVRRRFEELQARLKQLQKS